MKTVKETIIDHFREDHLRLLGGASLSAGDIPPSEFLSIGEVQLHPSGTDVNGLDFTASFQIGRMKVFYFGTITDDRRIENEAIAGRNADGTMPRIS